LLLKPEIFRAYDIRGIFDEDFDKEGVKKIGNAFCQFIKKKYNKNNPKIVVGRDGRVSSPQVAKSFITGILENGGEVTFIGLATSPLLNFAICEGSFDGGVNITASHNPAEWNGIKLQSKNAHSVCGEEIQKIWQLCQNYIVSENNSKKYQEADFSEKYLQKILQICQIPKKPKVVVDCGNGVAGKFAPMILEKLGCQVVPVFCEIDGNFPNHDPDPEREENLNFLKKLVLENSADFGIAFDGDGDRAGFIDNKGKFWPADLILLILSRDFLSRNPGGKIVLDLKVSQILIEEIIKLGGQPILVKTGHSFVEQKMKKVGAGIGGELSGHFFFAENYFGFDDGILAAAKVLEILQKSGKNFAENFKNLPKIYNTPEIKISVPEKEKFSIIEKLVKILEENNSNEKILKIDGIRIDFQNGSWGIIRASNTSPFLTTRFEARNLEDLEKVKNIFFQEVKKFSQLSII